MCESEARVIGFPFNKLGCASGSQFEGLYYSLCIDAAEWAVTFFISLKQDPDSAQLKIDYDQALSFSSFLGLFPDDSWHDAGTYDAKTKTGGANGSIRNEKEYSHDANAGLKIAIDFCGMLIFVGNAPLLKNSSLLKHERLSSK